MSASVPPQSGGGNEVEPALVTCVICGLVMNEAGEWASPEVMVSCKLEMAERARELFDKGDECDVLRQMEDLLDDQEGTA